MAIKSNTLIGYDSSLGSNSMITNANVVKKDIMNEINTRKGSYLGKPQYGTDIQDMIFEQMTDANIMSIETSIQDVFTRDGRAVIKTINVIENSSINTITVTVEFYYTVNYIVDTLSINFDTYNSQ